LTKVIDFKKGETNRKDGEKIKEKLNNKFEYPDLKKTPVEL